MRPADDSVVSDILGHFGSLMRHVAGTHAADFLEVEVTMSQAKCLYVVSVRPGIGMSALADQLRVTPAALSGLVDRLVEHGYLARREDPSDRRQLRVSLTDAGSAVMEHIRELNERQLRHLLAGLSRGELESLRTGMAALDREARHLHDHDLADAHTGPERTDA